MKVRVILCFLICMILLSGCFNYKDIDKAIFSTAVIIDVNEDGNVVLYSELFHTYRSKKNNTETGTRLIFSATGKTLFEAVRNQNKTASDKINYQQNKIIIFTKRAAEYGIDHFIDFLNRDQELLIRQYILLFEGDPKELIQLNIKQEEYLGLYLYELVRNDLISKFADIYQVYEYLNNKYIGNSVEVMGIVKIKEEALEDDISIEGAGILMKGKLIDKMEPEEEKIYNEMMGEGTTRVIILPHPTIQGKQITLEVLNSKLKSSVFYDYDHDEITLKKDFKLKISFAESEDAIDLDEPEIIKKIEKAAEEELKKRCTEFFKKYKEKRLDVFRIQEMVSRKYPDLEIENPIDITELKIVADAYIEGSSDVQDFESE